MKLKRLCIYTKDIMIITGKSERAARKLLQEMKKHFGKEPNQYISLKEFSTYTGLNLEDINLTIQD